ncbi:Uncharacterised protein [Yersinia pseudotuberculosis]|uniref:hypothetical protein n=1 Tax=Yersinia pseudotuberculosis TaxID=633 RepID=UPI000E013FDB|nr:hypothetical protein [Yersinia pseudotuberculosis]SUP94326.1 Uncharacterised protein [Yersinia pseudotuberculosis]
MSSYGLEVFRRDGTSIILDNQTSVTKILTMGGRESGVGSWNTGVTIPEGFDYFIWMSSYAWLEYVVAVNGGKSQWTPARHAYNQPSLDANRVLKVNSVNYNTIIPGSYFGVYTWPTGVDQGNYGIQFFGANNIAGITDASQFTCLLFKGEVDIYNGWLPSNINAEFTPDKVICFFYTEDESKTICAKSARYYNSPSAVRDYSVYSVGGGESSTPIRAKVCIFGNGQLQKENYGLEIYSAVDKSLVYNSGYDILARPKLIRLAGMALGEKKSVEGIPRPMYAICNIGGLFTNNWQVNVWINSNGTQIGPAWGRAIYEPASFGPYTYFTADIQIMVLDATDYFHF